MSNPKPPGASTGRRPKSSPPVGPSYAIVCPVCAALPGARCYDINGTERDPHVARVMRGNKPCRD